MAMRCMPGLPLGCRVKHYLPWRSLTHPRTQVSGGYKFPVAPCVTAILVPGSVKVALGRRSIYSAFLSISS